MLSERNKTAALISAVGIALLVLVALAYGGVSGRDISSWSPVVIGFSIPIITSLLLAAGIQSQLQSVHEKVNGNYHTLAQENAALREQVQLFAAAMPPEQAAQIITGSIPVTNRDDSEKGKHSL